MSESTWAVIDVETTGLNPVRDRVVEIAVVELDSNALVTNEWTTLVSPGNRELLTRVHGIKASDLENAPTYAEILPDLHARLSGRVLVAHNAPFDVAFLQAESNRAGVAWGPVEGMCTLAITKDLGLTKSRNLELACKELGIVVGTSTPQ